MKKKQQKKRVKKYKGKYVTANRVDMSKGGRVKAQVGGIQKAPISRKKPPMSIEREEEVRPTVPTTKPVQPQLIPQRNNTQVADDTIAQPKQNEIIPNTSTGNQQQQTYRSREEAAAALAGLTLEEYRARQLENSDNKITNVVPRRPNFIGEKGSDQMFIDREGDVRPQQAQSTSRGSGFSRLFRTVVDKTKDQAEQAQSAQAQSAQAQSAQTVPGFMTREEFNKQYGDYEGPTPRGSAASKARVNFDRERSQAYEDYLQSLFNVGGGYGGYYGGTGNGTGQATIDGKPLITGTPEQLEAERGKRVIQTGRTAEEIATGKIPEGTIPTAELQKVMERRPDETEEAYQARLAETQAEAIQIDPITGVKAIPVEAAPSQVVETMEAATIQTPEELQAAKVQAEQVAKTPEVDIAAGEVVEDALAKAAKVDRVAPIEGAEVEIPEGALAERVVGTISEGAKATAALNVGTSLSRITRAKKQLSRAGLSDADIEEIGNDPEALEDRLADFSEEQRGIIEGLPQEALVSTQMNNLLEGIESGEIPTWARPAVAQVEQMLARRGMSASTVGRDSLFNAIIQSAMPIAQSNAQAIQQSVSQQKTIEAQTAEANAQRMQQTALTNAQNVFNMDMAQFNADQQTALSNSKFLQTVGLTEASNEQQATIQNAVLMSQANLAEADFYQKAQINNANAFLKMDMQNLANEQQVNIVKAQQEQQRMLSNQAATNAARQFNAASENQTQQFMASLEAQVNQFNVAQVNAATQFNVQSKNVAAAREADRIADVNKTNATILNQVNQFNAQLDYNRQQWNAANEQAVLNSNVNWRRQANLADTAAQNAINQQNAQNAFGLTSSALSFLWQELRDQADYDFRFGENDANRKLNAMIAAAGSEGDAAKNWSTNFNNASSTIDRIFGQG